VKSDETQVAVVAAAPTATATTVRPMGSVEEEMEKLEASSNLLDTSIESEGTTLLEMQRKEEESSAAGKAVTAVAEQESEDKACSNVSMEVDSETVSTSDVEVTEIKEAKVSGQLQPETTELNLIEQLEANLATCMDKRMVVTINESAAIDIKTLNQLDDRIDEAKLQLISYFNSLQKAIRGRVDKIRTEAARK
jgi:hypothetical protein